VTDRHTQDTERHRNTRTAVAHLSLRRGFVVFLVAFCHLALICKNVALICTAMKH